MVDWDKLSNEEKMRLAKERSKKYGIAVKPWGRRSPPKGYPKDERLYADPVNFMYRLDTKEYTQAAIRYWGKYRDRYTKKEQKIIERRMRRAAEKFGIDASSLGMAKIEKIVTLETVEMAEDTEGDSFKPVILKATALKPGVWNKMYEFDADVIRKHAKDWLGVDVLATHDMNNPLAVAGKITKAEATADGELTLYFETIDTSAGRDINNLIRNGEKLSVSVGFKGDTEKTTNGTYKILSIEPDHLAILRYGHQAVENAHVEVIKFEWLEEDEDEEVEEVEDEERKEFEEKIKELEEENQNLKAQIAELQKQIEQQQIAELKAKMQRIGLEYDEEKSLDENKQKYFEALEQKVLELQKVSEPVKVKELKNTDIGYRVIFGDKKD